MKIIVALVFIVVSATAYLDDRDDQTYFIQSAVTRKYLYVGHTLDVLDNGIGTSRNVSILETANKIPTQRSDTLFLLVKNNVIGPYYNIINLGTNSTLIATDILIGYESGCPANKVIALNNATLKNAPEAIWNIRTFLNTTYILNVHFGSYLYANNAINSSAVLEGNSSFPLLLPSEIAGRARGTQWLIVRNDANVGVEVEDEGQMDRKDIEKMTETRVAKDVKKVLEEHLDNQQGVIKEKVNTKEDEKLGNEEVVVEEKVVKMDGEQLRSKKDMEEENVVKKEVEQMEIEPEVGEKKVDMNKYEQVGIVPLVKMEKLDMKEDMQGRMESGAGEEKVEKNEDDQKEIPPWMTPMEPWLRDEKLRKKEDEHAQMQTGTKDEEKMDRVEGGQTRKEAGQEDEEKVDGVEGEQVQMSPGVEEVKSMRDEKLERSAMLGWETRARVEHKKVPTVDPNDPAFKAFALMFNCHLTTTKSPFRTTTWSIFWPYPYPDAPYERSETVG